MTAANATRTGRAGAAQDVGATRDDASRLPALGRKGGGWVAIQMALLVAAVVAGLAGAAWPHTVSPWLAAAGVIVALAGAGLMVGGGAGLGKQLTPFPRPVDDGSLRQDGVYGLVRHPMYGGALLLMLGWALLSSPVALIPLAVAAVFLDAKRRREEAWLSEEYAGYADYRRSVRRQFIPVVW
jgi:protein-S-isoprenylcysteine O-methyltransferase Ste14